MKVTSGEAALPPVTVVLTGEEAVQLWKELALAAPSALAIRALRDSLGDVVRPFTAVYRLPTELT